MRYLKLYENFGEYYESIDDLKYALDVEWCGVPSDPITEIEIEKIRNLSNCEPKKISRSEMALIFKEHEFLISKSKDDWFYVVYNFYGLPHKYFKCDQIEGLLKYLSDYLDDNLNESLDDSQIEELSDLFVEVSDKFGLNEAISDGTVQPPGQRPGDNGAWRLSRLSNVYTELFVQINVEQVDIFKFEDSLEQFLAKAERLGHRIERLWWRDRYKYDNMYRASRYMIKIW